MTEQETLARLALALAIGFLVGVERGWSEREEAEGTRVAGLRTFSLIGLFGGVWGLLSGVLGPVVLGFAFLALAGAMTLFKWQESLSQKDYGITTLVAALLTFSLGAYAILGDMTVAVAAAVAMVALLAAKAWLHAWLKHLNWEELRAALILLAMSFVALPVLPDKGYGPEQALNPYRLWLMAVAIAAVSFIGYVAIKVAGTRRGALIAGAAGGLVSSTVATIDLARKAKATPERARYHLAGALAASAVMFLRVIVIVALFRMDLLQRLAIVLGLPALVVTGTALLLGRGGGKEDVKEDDVGYSNPFEVLAVLRFAALLAAILVISRILAASFGGGGTLLLAGATGLADVDAITLSMTQIGVASVSAGVAALAILVAVIANSLSKSVLAIVIGGLRFGAGYAAVTAAALVIGVLAGGLADGWAFLAG